MSATATKQDLSASMNRQHQPSYSQGVPPLEESSSLGPFRMLYRIRYVLARPLNFQVLPSFIPSIPLPYLKHVPFITVGDVLLILPWLVIFMIAYDKTFQAPSLEGGGHVASYAIIAAFITANKANSFFHFFFGLSFERMVPLHNLYACLALITSVFHLYVAYVHGDEASGSNDGEGGGSSDRRLSEVYEENDTTIMDGTAHYAIKERPGADDFLSMNLNLQELRRLSGDESIYGFYGPNPNFGMFLWDGYVNFTGSVCTACLVGLVLTSFFRIIRKYLYEPWLVSHILCSIGTIAFGIMHSVPILIFPLVWWLVDIALRYVLQSQCRFPTTASPVRCSDDLVEVKFTRTFDFQAGQFVRISVPSVGLFQFHPITIASAPHEKDVTLYIKALGGWSRNLVKLADKMTPTDQISIMVEGPFGNLSFDVDNEERYPFVVCISGGIGVTPCESVARHVLHRAKQHGRALRHLRFVWVVRDMDTVRSFPTVATDGSMTDFAHESEKCHILEAGEEGTEELSDEVELATNAKNATKPTTSRVLLPQVFVTRGGESSTAHDEEVSTSPDLFHMGRPDIDQILEDTMRLAQSQGVKRVAIITCGPEALVHSVKDRCRKLSNCQVALDVHDEVFDY